jgi:YD repeat-containing protein
LFTKSVYDGLARVTHRYVGFDTDETTYAEASAVSDDTLLEQAETTYDDAHNLIEVTMRQRYHNATGTGELGSPSSTQPKARVSYQAHWHDALGRQVATANYGTNGGSALSRPGTIPARSDTVLISSTGYDEVGQVATQTDPAEVVTCLGYDAVGREVEHIRNCIQGSSSSSSSSSSWSSSSEGCGASDDSNVTIRTSTKRYLGE